MNFHPLARLTQTLLENQIERKIIKGPVVHMPKSNEWIHKFSWHGADPKDSTKKIPNGLMFKKLRLISDQMYYDVPNVRTKDDAVVVVQLMIFFKIIDIDRVLDNTRKK